MRLVYRHATLLCASLAIPLAGCGSSQPDPAQTSATASTDNAAEPTPAQGAAAEANSAPAPAPESGPPPPGGVPIRGKGGLEERCQKEVAKQGLTVMGTNRIEEEQVAIEIYVNVEGAQAPWRCRGYRDGRIERVEYSETEGEL